MPVILHKAKTSTSVPAEAAPSFESLIQALKDQIDRRTTAEMLGITIRTLLRWHHQNFGPKRLVLSAGRYAYRRAEVEAWVAERGQSSHRPRTKKGG
jgi:predicted DNA-binding transcriptional regulator AlpA